MLSTFEPMVLCDALRELHDFTAIGCRRHFGRHQPRPGAGQGGRTCWKTRAEKEDVSDAGGLMGERKRRRDWLTCSPDATASAAAHIMRTREGWRSLDSTTTTKMLRGRRNRFKTCDGAAVRRRERK